MAIDPNQDGEPGIVITQVEGAEAPAPAAPDVEPVEIAPPDTQAETSATPISDEDAQANLRAYVDQAPVGEDGKKVGWDWYFKEHDHVGNSAKKVGMDPSTFAAIVARTSLNTNWNQNVPLAERMARLSIDHPGESAESILDSLGDHPGYIKDGVVRSIKIGQGEDPAEHLHTGKGYGKLWNFYHNLADPEDHQDKVTLDRWMHRAVLGGREPTNSERTYFTGSGYEWLADQVRAIAKETGYAPHSIQAIIWEEIRKVTPKKRKRG